MPEPKKLSQYKHYWIVILLIGSIYFEHILFSIAVRVICRHIICRFINYCPTQLSLHNVRSFNYSKLKITPRPTTQLTTGTGSEEHIITSNDIILGYRLGWIINLYKI